MSDISKTGLDFQVVSLDDPIHGLQQFTIMGISIGAHLIANLEEYVVRDAMMIFNGATDWIMHQPKRDGPCRK